MSYGNSLRPSDKLKNLFHSHPARLHVAILFILGITSYANSFAVPLHYDDFSTLRKTVSGPLKLGFSGGMRWVTDLTFSLNRLVHSEAVAGFHAVNLAIHLASAVCIYYLVLLSITAIKSSFKLSGNDEQHSFLQSFIPFATAALFVCHPVQTQAVTYIAQRYTSLATCFYLASMLSYLQARLRRTGTGAWFWGGTSLVMALMAMMSKEIAFTLPLMLVVLELALFRGRLLKNPIFLLLGAGLLLIIPLQLLRLSEMNGLGDMLQGLQRASAEVQYISRSDYSLTQLRVIATYLRLMILPVSQNLDYDYPIYHSIAAPQVLASLFLHLSLAGAALFLAIRSQRRLRDGDLTSGTTMRLAALGIVWFYLALAVESSVIPIRDVINEHRLYLPSGGFLLFLTSLLGYPAALRAGYRKAVWTFVVLCCLVLTAGTIARNWVWKSEISLWQDVQAKSPNKARAHYNAGFHYAKWSMLDKGLPHLIRAIELAPEEDICWIALNSAIIQLNTFDGRHTSGMEYQTMIDSDDSRLRKPWQALNYINLGLAYEYSGNLHLARKNYELAASLNPDLDFAWLNLVVVAARQQNKPRFSTALARLQTINPALARAASTIRFIPRTRRP